MVLLCSLYSSYHSVAAHIALYLTTYTLPLLVIHPRARGKISSLTTACHAASAFLSAMLMRVWLTSGFDTAAGKHPSYRLFYPLFCVTLLSFPTSPPFPLLLSLLMYKLRIYMCPFKKIIRDCAELITSLLFSSLAKA